MPVTPNFNQGRPPEERDGSWVAKYDGSCDHCEGEIVAGRSRVRWNDDGTAVVCSHHRSRNTT